MNKTYPPVFTPKQYSTPGPTKPPVFAPAHAASPATPAQRKVQSGPVNAPLSASLALSSAPPVYRAVQVGAAQAMRSSGAAAPPVYRPAPPRILQLKPFTMPGASPTALRPHQQAAAIQAMKAARRNGGGGDDPGDDRRKKDFSKPHYEPYGTRKSTKQKTKDTDTRLLAGPEPTGRPRRNSASYRNVELFGLHGVAPDQELRNAIRAKKIWSGSRNDVSWSNGFADGFWKDSAVGGTWVCAHAYPGVCVQSVPAATHQNMEIGHRKGFYNQIVDNVDPIVVCDGTKHWEVMLFSHVQTANEDMTNLEPQCTSCNRDPRQKRNDDEGNAKYKPEEQGACPGETCTMRKISEL